MPTIITQLLRPDPPPAACQCSTPTAASKTGRPGCSSTSRFRAICSTASRSSAPANIRTCRVISNARRSCPYAAAPASGSARWVSPTPGELVPHPAAVTARSRDNHAEGHDRTDDQPASSALLQLLDDQYGGRFGTHRGRVDTNLGLLRR